MVELATREQALAYLEQMSPTETFQVHPFKGGWVATTVLSPEQVRAGQSVGSARLVIDSETGIIYQYPSWPTVRVAEAHTTFKQTGVNRAGRRIYPDQWTITVRRIGEDDQTITYQLTAESLTDPPEATQQHSLTIAKRNYQVTPSDPVSRRAGARLEATHRSQGSWPERETIGY
ncbi:hypothetical protein ACWDTP_06225 [Mycobacterium sp. NPDC003449]